MSRENSLRRISESQLMAILSAREIGRWLQREHRDVAYMFRQGMSYAQISRAKRIAVKRKTTLAVAKSAVRYAIRGSCNLANSKAYEGLIGEGEIDSLRREHASENGKRNGNRNYRNKVGIHGLSEEKRTEYSRLGGERAGRKNYERGFGIHGLSYEKRIENAGKAGRVGGIKSYRGKKGIHSLSSNEREEIIDDVNDEIGNVLWHKIEKDGMRPIEMALGFSRLRSFQRGNGAPNLQMIADALNVRMYDGFNVVTRMSVAQAFERYKKKLRDGSAVYFFSLK